MRDIKTGVKDCNSVEVLSTDKVRYTYFRCGRVSHTGVYDVKWDNDEGTEGWCIGGSLLSSIGKFDNKKEREIIEVVRS